MKMKTVTNEALEVRTSLYIKGTKEPLNYT